MGGKGAPGLKEESGPRERRLGLPPLQPHFCSSVDPAWVAAAQHAWGPPGRSSPLRRPLCSHSGHLHLRHLPFPHGSTTPPLLCLSAPGSPRMLSPAYIPELSRVLSKATARTGGGRGDAPSFSRVLPGLSPAPLRLPSPPVGGPRPRSALRGTGGRAPRARWLNPPEWREGTLPSRGDPLLLGNGTKGTRAFVLPGLDEAALPTRSAGGAGAPGSLTFARGVWKVASSCLLGRGRRELGSGGRERERSVGGGVVRVGQALCLHWGRGEGGLKVDSSLGSKSGADS